MMSEQPAEWWYSVGVTAESSLRVEGGADNLWKSLAVNLVMQARGEGIAFLMRQVTQAA